MKDRLTLFLVSVLCSGVSYAQAPEQKDSIDVRIYFKQGSSVIDMKFKDNQNRLGTFVDRIAELKRDSLSRILSIYVSGTASPEGNSRQNKLLSRKRAASAAGYVHKFLPDHIEIDGKGIDWEGLAKVVERTDYQYKKEVLDILRNVPEWIVRKGVVVDGKKKRLTDLHGGKVWKYLLQKYFPEVRKASVKVIYSVKPNTIPELPPSGIVDSVKIEEVLPDSAADLTMKDNADITYTSTDDLVGRLRFAIRTNALYNLALIPNIGAEFYLNNGWTIGGNWMYAWWKTDRRHRYWRTYGGDIEVRKYLKCTTSDIPYNRHYVGLYAQILTYDFELGGKGYMGGKPGGTLWDRMNYVVAAEYGYSLPVARRLNIDFGIGVGYMGGKYYEYEPIDAHYVWQATKQRKWFGPTKAEISLKWLIGRGNTNGHKK